LPSQTSRETVISVSRVTSTLGPVTSQPDNIRIFNTNDGRLIYNIDEALNIDGPAFANVSIEAGNHVIGSRPN
jgi:hypothetical protein